MNQAMVNDKYKVSPFYVFFLVHSMQTGVGVLNFQRLLAKSTGTDGWISILLAGLVVHLLIWIIYKIFSIVPGDIIYVNHQAFGKVIGNFFNIVIIFYYLTLGMVVMISYINVIHLWLYDEVGSWAFALVFLILIYYILTGGFRTITGIAFLSVMLSFWLTFILFYAMRYSEITNLLPLFDHHLLEIVKGMKDTSLTMIGFELILMFYPFIKDAKTSQKFAHGGALTTTLLTLFIYIITLIFYSQKQLELTIWPTLTMTSVIQLPFIQRFEYITVSWWALVIIPNMALSLWAASRGVKVLLNVKQKYPLWILSIFILFINIAFFDVDILYVLNKIINPYYVLFFVVYLPFLLIFIYIRKMRNFS
ncbi:GerAB/ArcD/ProY family transporter [Peribacillus psychrosaccharolyticus]|uniref:GerAB/ArcD/ProY family transporter n=1 Tax=Peribacillus psychrosaccharolyticus TaxID=1407 RepID=A0A974NMW9_PERPY|nr:GerAB/ArcD/ProY family transporter [Peribacillus psychrosaccharolyticus]MEC2056254.1 GerAB/ArcD/ProY family transporter [Peribacillus psychrosaccharolyticus]MED3743656.1 GerAB/ArcD/ProY family transporter [Peribacillus psychrosaccharolyticus]QQT00570.1 GerAB/ArcD/ProY family transporter [Peribacillus psychrosaccharolyticus]